MSGTPWPLAYGGTSRGTSTALPGASQWTEAWTYRGSGRLMASGAVHYDLVTSGTKRIFTCTWMNKTDAERSTIETFIDALGVSSIRIWPPQENTGTDGSPAGGTNYYIVTRDEALSPLEWVTIRTGAKTFLHTATVIFREV